MRLRELFWGKHKANVKESNTQEELVKEEQKNGILIMDETEEKCESVRKKVEKSLTILNVKLDVDCTTDSYFIMEYGIRQLPALLLNGKILIQGKRIDVPELVQLLQNYI